MRIKETITTVFALVFCMTAGAAGYHQVLLVGQPQPQVLNPIKPAVLVSVDKTDEKTIEELTLQVPDDIKVICAKYGAEYGIEPELLEAIAWRESRFTPNVISENGTCKGLMQINETVHKDRMQKLGVTDIYDIDGNIHVASDYLAELIAENDNIDYVLARYHGESRPEKILNGAKPSNYVRQIQRVRSALKAMRKEV